MFDTFFKNMVIKPATLWLTTVKRHLPTKNKDSTKMLIAHCQHQISTHPRNEKKGVAVTTVNEKQGTDSQAY